MEEESKHIEFCFLYWDDSCYNCINNKKVISDYEKWKVKNSAGNPAQEKIEKCLYQIPKEMKQEKNMLIDVCMLPIC